MRARSPGRPREFDLETALDAAVSLFWERGYAATSIADLTEVLGVSRSSLYQVFGSKDGIFAAALTRYAAVELDRLTTGLREPENGLAAIDAFLGGLVSHLATPRGRLGCLVTNTTTELGAVNSTVRTRVAGLVASLESALHACLVVARTRGDLPPDADVDALARHLTAVAQGLQVLAKTEPGETYLRDIATVALWSVSRPTESRPTGAGL